MADELGHDLAGRVVIPPPGTLCPRCGGEHWTLIVYPLTNPGALRYTHWAVCPKTKEPVLILFPPEEDPERAAPGSG